MDYPDGEQGYEVKCWRHGCVQLYCLLFRSLTLEIGMHKEKLFIVIGKKLC